MHAAAPSRIRLERPAGAHVDEFIAAVARSRALHADFVAPPETPQAFRRFVRQGRLASEVRFLSVTSDTLRIAGVLTLGGIVREPLQSASVGYYAFEPYAGRGLMREAVGLLIAYAFDTLRLVRLDASIRPDNERSRLLAQRLGFRCDGLALHDVRIGGRWYAHERWALLAAEWRGAAEPARGTRDRRAGTVEVHCRRRIA